MNNNPRILLYIIVLIIGMTLGYSYRCAQTDPIITKLEEEVETLKADLREYLGKYEACKAIMARRGKK